jgi:hypothetical protein
MDKYSVVRSCSCEDCPLRKLFCRKSSFVTFDLDSLLG